MHTLKFGVLRNLPVVVLGGLLVFGGQVTAFAQVASKSPAAIGEVEFSRGVGFAQSGNQMPRTLGKGLALAEGDRLTTAEGASAIVRLQDGTRMTVRPNSEMVLQQFQYREASTDNSMVMQLLRGGFRAITGLIAKSSPIAARVTTKTATIGIRGTDFDARICGADCKAESAEIAEQPRLNTILASAKVISVDGDLSAVDAAGARRRLVAGGSVYAGETVETGMGTKAVLAFRDESRTTLGSSTRLRVDSFVFDAEKPKEGRFLVSLLRGSLRALTGLIGKANNRNVGFSTPTATIGIRGTGLDMDCATDAGCSLFTWLGTIEVTPNGQTALQVLQAGQGLFVSPTAIRPLSAPTLQELQRPDGVQVDMRQLFGSEGDAEQEGLYVFVRDGHIQVTTGRGTLHLGRGETGFAANDGQTGRPLMMPLFLEFDRTPMPNSANPALASVLNDTRLRPLNQCR